MSFSQLLSRLSESNFRRATIPADWGQGRATFGGLVAALSYAPMRAQVPEERALRSLSISFVGPAAPGEIEFDAKVLRQGKSVTQVEGHATQDGEVVAALLASFGAPRESAVAVAAEPAPTVAPPEQCEALPFVADVSPEFTRHIEVRWGIGDRPFQGSRERKMGGWVRFREPQPTLTEAHLLGLIDAWPPALLPLLTRRAPSSSLSWNVEFIQPLPSARADDWWLYEAVIDEARDGYGHVAARFWTRDGELVAVSRQTVTVFA